MAAAVAERQFLAQVEHPNIVRIYNFVQHASRATARPPATSSWSTWAASRSRRSASRHASAAGAVPLAHALAYALEILPAFGYLHDRGLVYCDFKPDNIIQTEEQLKLIDMGGVRHIDDDGAIYGTVGYQAPEIETEGPSPSSDLYTVGRTLAVLTFEFAGLPGRVPVQAARVRAAARPSRSPTPGCCAAPRTATRTHGSSRRARWPSSSPACCARCSRSTTAQARPAFSGLFSPELRAVGTDLSPGAAERYDTRRSRRGPRRRPPR